MTQKTYANLLLFALLGIALWFFGNLYEGIVITPNLLIDPTRKIYYWREFFRITNPIFFYIPLAPAAILSSFVLYFKTPKEKIVLKRYLRYATFFLSIALAVGVFIISQINLKLFYGHIVKNSTEIYRLSVLWNLLNILRVILLAFTIYYVFNAYIFIQRNV
jgi:hypothetical protein